MAKIVKPSTEREKAAANFVLKGALTRIALMFQMSGRSFTGTEVAEIIIAVLIGHERGAEPEQVALTEGSNGPAIKGEAQP